MIYTSGKDAKAILKKRAKESGLSLTQIAINAKLSPQALNNRFSRKDFSIDELKRICAASGFSVVLDIVKSGDQEPQTDVL